jgi:N-acyl-D-aspartate/D-glutamate deacylase
MMLENVRLSRKVFALLVGLWAAVFLLMPMGNCRTAVASDEPAYDILIKGGTVYDGTLRPPFIADIGIKGDKITAIGTLDGKAIKIIQAKGFIVTPGFIDIHEHSDTVFTGSTSGSGAGLTPVMQEELKGNYNALYQGVTTVVTGNCGMGITDTAKWFKTVESIKFGTNVMHLIPHGEIRYELFGKKNQPGKLSRKQLRELKARIEKEMKAGACGLSTGLAYTPGINATIDELIELSKVVHKYSGIYATHMRDESGTILEDGKIAVLESIKEAIEIGRKSGAPVQISHLKLQAPHNGLKASQMLALIEAARQEGLDVTADSYPYTAGWSELAILLPSKFKIASGGISNRYKTKKGRAEIKAVVQSLFVDIPPEKIIVTACDVKEYEGKTLKEIAAREGKDPADSYTDLVCDHFAEGLMFAHNEQAMKDFIPNHYIFTSSDGKTWAKDMPGAHPRNYGAFVRKLKVYALGEEKQMDFNDALRSMTFLPAEKLGLRGRGKLEKGAFADIVVLDLNTLADHATYEKPTEYAEGIVHLLVNGVLSIEDRKLTGQRAGRALKGRGILGSQLILVLGQK